MFLSGLGLDAEISTVQEDNHFLAWAESSLSIGSVFNAVKEGDWALQSLPDIIAKSGFYPLKVLCPEGATPDACKARVSYAACKGKEKDLGNGLLVNCGTNVRGRIELHLSAGDPWYAEVNVGISKTRFYSYAVMEEINIGNGLLAITGYGGRGSPNPIFVVDVSKTSALVNISGKMSGLAMGISPGAALISLNDEGFMADIHSKVLGVFDTEIYFKSVGWDMSKPNLDFSLQISLSNLKSQFANLGR